MKKQNTLHDLLTKNDNSSFQKYRKMVLGQQSIMLFIKYEITTALFGSFPGSLGFLLRRYFFKFIIGCVGDGVIFGKDITIRHGHKIHIGSKVVVDDHVVLDAKGDFNQGILLEDDSIISRNSVLSCKDGSIRIGKNVSLGINSLIHSIKDSDVNIGENAIIGAFTYLIGGGNYHYDEMNIPIKEQGTYSKGGINVGENVWIGSHVQILDGVKIGNDSIIAAGAVVNQNIPDFTVAGGVPARIIKKRKSC